MQRLDKYLSEAGVESRRKLRDMIRAGRVSVNGAVVTELGTKVEAGDTVCFDGKKVEFEPTACILFYKPSQVMCTSDDPQGRPIVNDYFRELPLRLYTVGRLDYDTEGTELVQVADPRA